MRPRLILSFLESRVLATREVGVHSYVFAACEGGILIFSSEAYALSRLVSCSLRSSCALLYLYRTRGRNSDFLFGGLCPLASRVLATCVVRVHSFIFAAREGGIPVFSSEAYALVSRVSCPCCSCGACAPNWRKTRDRWLSDQGSRTRLFHKHVHYITRGSISRKASVKRPTKTLSLFWYIAAKRVKKQCCALYHHGSTFSWNNSGCCKLREYWLLIG